MKPYYEDAQTKIYQGDAHECMSHMAEESVDCCVSRSRKGRLMVSTVIDPLEKLVKPETKDQYGR